MSLLRIFAVYVHDLIVLFYCSEMLFISCVAVNGVYSTQLL